MNDTALLDEVEEYLNTGTIKGVPFSDHGVLERLRDYRPAKETKEGNRRNGVDVIPEMTDPLGRHWDQPDRQFLFFVGTGEEEVVHIGQKEFDQLAVYDTSMPSGVYPGKMWKRTNGDTTWLVWYGEVPGNPKLCSNNSCRLIVTGD